MNDNFLGLNGLTVGLLQVQQKLDRQFNMFNPLKQTLDMISRAQGTGIYQNLGKPISMANLTLPLWTQSMQNELASYKKMSDLSAQSNVLKMLSSTNFVQQYMVPDYLARFSSGQASILHKLNSMKPLMQAANLHTSLNGLGLALSMASLGTFGSAMRGRIDNETVDQIDAQTAEISDLADGILSSSIASPAEIERMTKLFAFLLRFDFKANPHVHGGLMAVLFALFQIFLTVKPKDAAQLGTEIASHVENFKADLKKSFDHQLETNENIRIARHPTRLYLHNSTQSPVICLVPEDQTVHVTAIERQWVYINYISPEGMPVNGWVMKKYFSQR